MTQHQHTNGSRSYSNDPGDYTEPHLLVGVPTDVLERLYLEAEHTYRTCGGHNLAERMRRVMRLIDENLTARGIDRTPRPTA